jgi:putative ABC transport system permease protein
MLKTFVHLITRNFYKKGFLNILNILGLSLGMCAAMLIALYADHEYGYDKFHNNADNIYRMEGRSNNPIWLSNLGTEYARELVSGKYPEVKGLVQINNSQQTFLQHKSKRFFEKKIFQTKPGSAFFEFFNFDFIEGNNENLLEAPYSVVITESIKQKYFEDDLAVGETIMYDTIPLKVTAVIEDLPSNSHLDFDIIYTNPRAFGDGHYHTNSYFELVDNVDPLELENTISAINLGLDDFHTLTEINLIALPHIYFDSQASFGSGGIGDKLQLRVFIVIGFLILLIAVANYINLSLATYSGKGLEIGIRKVLGETKQQVIQAFFYESLLNTLLALPLLILWLKLTIPIFSDFLNIRLENKLVSNPIYWIAIIVFTLIVSLITVIYPATVLNNTKLSTLIKSKAVIHQKGGFKLRNVLLFIQFIILFTLGISAWFMNRQINYMDQKDMGFNAEGVIKIRNAFNIGSFDNYRVLKTELLKNPKIEAVAFGPMMGDNMTQLAYQAEGNDQVYENLLSYGVDIDYFEVMSMNILEGDFKNKLIGAENGKIISLVNKSFVNANGWENNPIGKKITLRPGTENELQREVTAVFKDFHFFSLKEIVSPQIISLRSDPQFVNTNILVKAAVPELKRVIEAIEQEWKKIRPDVPFEYDLMEDAVKSLYDQERQTSQISLIFSVLAIALSLLGLMGFMIYIVSQKAKELAIRKVLGASLLQIVRLLNKQLIVAILFAAIIGSGFSYWLIQEWLNDYAYSISLSPLTFVAALFIVYFLVFGITTIQSLKSNNTNPVMALKNE